MNSMHQNLDGVLDGFNTTFFAFGITGSGKTYTIFGEDNKKTKKNNGIS